MKDILYLPTNSCEVSKNSFLMNSLFRSVEVAALEMRKNYGSAPVWCSFFIQTFADPCPVCLVSLLRTLHNCFIGSSRILLRSIEYSSRRMLADVSYFHEDAPTGNIIVVAILQCNRREKKKATGKRKRVSKLVRFSSLMESDQRSSEQNAERFHFRADGIALLFCAGTKRTAALCLLNSQPKASLDEEGWTETHLCVSKTKRILIKWL